MHIVLALLGSIVTLLYLLDRLGVDLGGLNPFYWRRRRAWSRKYEGDPIHSVEDPMEIAALFVVGVARLDGDVSAGQKAAAIAEFERRFSMSSRDATQLFGSSAHLLGQAQVIQTQLDGVLQRHPQLFSADQADSLIDMMTAVAGADGAVTDAQSAMIAAVREQLARPAAGDGVWEQRT